MPYLRLPLLLLPGLLNDARLWQHQLAGLDDIAEPRVGDLTQADAIPALAAHVLGHVDEPRFVLAGLSMGGYVALEILRQAPERVMALALIDTSARPDTPDATAQRRAAMTRSATDFAGVVDDMLRRVLLPAHYADPAIVEPARAMARRVGPEAYLRQQQAIIGRADSRPGLRDIECPALVMCGREDVVTPVEVHEEMRDAIAFAQLVVLGECGHLSPMERGPEVTGALRAFIERVRTASAP